MTTAKGTTPDFARSISRELRRGLAVAAYGRVGGQKAKAIAVAALAVGLGLSQDASAQMSERSAVLASIDAKAASYGDVALEIWSFAEVGYQDEVTKGRAHEPRSGEPKKLSHKWAASIRQPAAPR